MAKISEATLKKKAELKAQIAELQKSMVMSAVPLMRLPNTGKKLADASTNVLRRKIRLTAEQTAWLLNLKAAFKTNWKYYHTVIDDSFIVGAALYPHSYGRAPLRYVFDWPFAQHAYLTAEKLSVQIVPYDKGIVRYIECMPIANEAYAITWPNELGDVMLYYHRKTALGRHFTKDYSATPPNGLIYENLPGLRDWTVLAHYITHADKVERHQVCDIVKAITAAESKEELQQMADHGTELVGLEDVPF